MSSLGNARCQLSSCSSVRGLFSEYTGRSTSGGMPGSQHCSLPCESTTSVASFDQQDDTAYSVSIGIPTNDMFYGFNIDAENEMMVHVQDFNWGSAPDTYYGVTQFPMDW